MLHINMYIYGQIPVIYILKSSVMCTLHDYQKLVLIKLKINLDIILSEITFDNGVVKR